MDVTIEVCWRIGIHTTNYLRGNTSRCYSLFPTGKYATGNEMGIGRRIELDGGSVQQTAARHTAPAFFLSTPKYALSDLILPPETRDEISRALAFRLHHDQVFEKWGFKHTHRNLRRVSLNFYGPPGTGKTMAAHAVAQALGKQLLIVNYAEIESKYVGETPKNLAAAFAFADREDAVIFFDEADALLSRRVTNMSNSTDTSVNQTRSVLLNILNDYSKTILFATNFIENFDPAFMRRILAHVKFMLPGYEERCRLFKMYMPDGMPQSIEVEAIARRHDGLSGSDIANAVLLAAFSAAERQKQLVTTEDLDSALVSIVASKQANTGHRSVVTREVSKKYAEQALGVMS